jgi:hypothetical protein
MAKIVQFRSRLKRREQHRSVDLDIAADSEIMSGANLRNLIDSWIVPKLVDEWMDQAASPDSHANDDNGEQS